MAFSLHPSQPLPHSLHPLQGSPNNNTVRLGLHEEAGVVETALNPQRNCDKSFMVTGGTCAYRVLKTTGFQRDTAPSSDTIVLEILNIVLLYSYNLGITLLFVDIRFKTQSLQKWVRNRFK